MKNDPRTLSASSTIAVVLQPRGYGKARPDSTAFRLRRLLPKCYAEQQHRRVELGASPSPPTRTARRIVQHEAQGHRPAGGVRVVLRIGPVRHVPASGRLERAARYAAPERPGLGGRGTTGASDWRHWEVRRDWRDWPDRAAR